MTGSAAGRQLWIKTSADATELRSLHDWLRREDTLRSRVRLAPARVEPGQMGGALDALVVAVGSGGMGAVLANALSAWITHRRSDVRITVTSEDGRKVELDAKRVDAHNVIASVNQLLDLTEPPQ